MSERNSRRPQSYRRKYLASTFFILLIAIQINVPALCSENEKCAEFSITRDEGHSSHRPVDKRFPPITEMADLSHTLSGYKYLYTLRRPSSRAVVAVLAIQQTGKPILNPRYLRFNYGAIPELESFSLETTEKFWGAGKLTDSEIGKKNEVVKTFKFISVRKNDIPSFSTVFKVDMVFSNNKLTRYRVKGSNASSIWLDPKYQQILKGDE